MFGGVSFSSGKLWDSVQQHWAENKGKFLSGLTSNVINAIVAPFAFLFTPATVVAGFIKDAPKYGIDGPGIRAAQAQVASIEKGINDKTAELSVAIGNTLGIETAAARKATTMQLANVTGGQNVAVAPPGTTPAGQKILAKAVAVS